MRRRRLAVALLQIVLVICIAIQPTPRPLGGHPPRSGDRGRRPCRAGGGVGGGEEGGGKRRGGGGPPRRRGDGKKLRERARGGGITRRRAGERQRRRLGLPDRRLHGGRAGHGAGRGVPQELLDRCFEQHLQPIIRVATRFDVETETWSRPGRRRRALAGVPGEGALADEARLGDRRQRAEPRARVGRRGRLGQLRRVPRALPGRVRRFRAVPGGQRAAGRLERHRAADDAGRLRVPGRDGGGRAGHLRRGSRAGPPTRTACRTTATTCATPTGRTRPSWRRSGATCRS